MGFNLGKIIGNVVGSSAGNLVESVANAADKFITTKAEQEAFKLELEKEINRHNEAMATLVTEETKAYLADTSNARDNNAKIQESDHASWLAKNVTYVLAVVVTVGFFGLLGYMLKYEVPRSNERIMDILLGALATAWISVISFFYGSSQGSRENTKIIKGMLANK